jgi:hypothetical protein
VGSIGLTKCRDGHFECFVLCASCQRISSIGDDLIEEGVMEGNNIMLWFSFNESTNAFMNRFLNPEPFPMSEPNNPKPIPSQSERFQQARRTRQPLVCLGTARGGGGIRSGSLSIARLLLVIEGRHWAVGILAIDRLDLGVLAPPAELVDVDLDGGVHGTPVGGKLEQRPSKEGLHFGCWRGSGAKG